MPLRSSLFDSIFKKLGIQLQTTGRCSWGNYQDFLETIANVHDVMKEYYQIEDVDLLDAHSFLWTINMNVLDPLKEDSSIEAPPENEKKIEVGAYVFHKDYGKGEIFRLTEKKTYVVFGGKQRIFPYPEAFEREYLILV